MNILIFFFSLVLLAVGIGFANHQELEVAGILTILGNTLCLAGLWYNNKSKRTK